MKFVKFFLWIPVLFILALVACSSGDEDNLMELSEKDRLFVQQENPPGFHESLGEYIWVVYVDTVGTFYSDSEPQVTTGSYASGGAYICTDGLVVHASRWKGVYPDLYPHGHCVGTGGKNHYRVYPQHQPS